MNEDRITIRGYFDTPAAMKSAQTIPTPVKIDVDELEFYLRKFFYIAECTPIFFDVALALILSALPQAAERSIRQ